MSYATATYGLAAMEAADLQRSAIVEPEPVESELEPELEVTLLTEKKETAIPADELKEIYKVRGPLAKATRKYISKYLGLKEHDIIAMYVKAGGNMFLLRHFLAVDKEKKAIVLAIRGTFSISGCLIDAQMAGGTLLVNRWKIWSGPRVNDASLTRLLVFDFMSKSLASLCYLCLYRHQLNSFMVERTRA